MLRVRGRSFPRSACFAYGTVIVCCAAPDQLVAAYALPFMTCHANKMWYAAARVARFGAFNDDA